jgi:DmsE family decaheme c-type cytochrome
MNIFRRALAILAIAVGFGWTGAGAATVAAQSAQDALKKDAVCTRCHDENASKPNVLYLYQGKHGVRADGAAPTCQSCHGESLKHLGGNVDGGGRPPVDVVFKKGGTYGQSDDHARAGACANCHTGKARTHWDGSQHQSAGVACNDCHKVHQPTDPVRAKATQPEVCFACHKEQRADSHKISTHPIEAGKVVCSDCHNPHGTTGPKLLVKNSVNATCYTCHAEKRGPFLWEHGPVADDCTNCHTPHGSVNAPLLKARAPWLCQECHSGDHGKQLNSGANLAGGNLTTINGAVPLASAAARAQMAGRACLNCHVLVHGSNHPAGAKFQR